MIQFILTKVRFLNIIDEYSRECIAPFQAVAGETNDIIEVLSKLILKGCSEYLRSDNGIEFTANKLRKWHSNVGE